MTWGLMRRSRPSPTRPAMPGLPVARKTFRAGLPVARKTARTGLPVARKTLRTGLPVARKTLRDLRWQVVGFGFGLAAVAALVVAIYPSYAETIEDLELPSI